MIWNLRNHEIFARRGYLDDNTMESFQLCANKGFHIETDCVKTKSGTFFMSHDRKVMFEGVLTPVLDLTDEQFLSVVPKAVTLTDFTEWLKKYPNMCVMCDFYVDQDGAIAQIAKSGTMSHWMTKVHNRGECLKYVEQYPELSYSTLKVIQNEAEIDEFRTPYNIVTSEVSGIDAKPNPNVLTCGSHVEMTPENVADWVATGATWFQPAIVGANLDAVKEELKKYPVPGYPNKALIRMCADAVKEKNQISGGVVGRNLPSEIRKIKTGSPADTLDMESDTNGVIASRLSIRGLQKLKTLNFKCSPKKNQSFYVFTLPDSENVTMNVIDMNPVVSGGDKFRGVQNITTVNFTPPVYPTDVWRYFYQCSATKITGIGLDNITGFAGGDEVVRDFDWVGELKNAADFSGFDGLSAYSIKGIISKLADYSTGDPHTVTLGATYAAMLTPEEIAAAKAKNWTIV